MILQLLQRVVTALEEKGIAYMVSGSVAMNTYVIPRMTRDIDIVIALKEQETEIFCQIFEKDFYIHKISVLEEVRRKGMFNVIDNLTGNKIDFMVAKESAYRQTEFSRRVRSNAFGFGMWLVSIEDLILSKIIWIQQLQSERQLTDIQNLLENEAVDRNYIGKWVQELNLDVFHLNL